MDNTRDPFAYDVYESLCGVVGSEFRLPWVENAFRPGARCDRRYAEVYNAAERLNDRLGTQEDPDVETIINALLDIQQELCLAMFRYGQISSLR